MAVSSDEDWFERALREGKDEEPEVEGSGTEPPGPGEDDDEDGATDESPGDEAGLFEDDFTDALSEADGPAGVEDADQSGPDAAGADEAFGMGGGADGDEPQGEFGMGESGASDEEFGMGEDAGAFGMGGDLDGDVDLDEEFGMGGDFGMGAGGDGEDFDDDEIESDLPRIKLGIEGLDEMVQGGVPERSLMVAIGSAGTGKTTFGMQFLDQALRNGERAVYITLEESRERVINSAEEKGMSYDEYAEEGRLAVVDIDPIDMANSLQSIRSELPALIEDFGASRLVLDSVSLLEMMYDDRAKRRNEIYDFTRSLKNAGVTTMLTSEASQDSAYASRHGIVEYLTDAVFILQYVRPSDFRETRLAVEIQKIRDANHSRETKPYEITDDGISVFQGANIF